jgi:hypothetical protein
MRLPTQSRSKGLNANRRTTIAAPASAPLCLARSRTSARRAELGRGCDTALADALTASGLRQPARRRVMDPEFGRDVVSLGMIRDVQVDDECGAMLFGR